MPELPKLDDDTARRSALQWDELLETHGFTGQHLKWRELKSTIKLPPPPINPVGTGGVWHGPPERAAREYEDVGFGSRFAITKTITLARERFVQFEEEHAKIWKSEGSFRSDQFARRLNEIQQLVEREIAALWTKDEWHSDWFKGTCLPKLQQELASLVKKYASDARKLEIQHLQPKTTRSGLPEQQRDYQFQLQLDEGRKALERAARVLGSRREGEAPSGRALCQEPLLKARSQAQANEQTAPGRQEAPAGQAEVSATAVATAGQTDANKGALASSKASNGEKSSEAPVTATSDASVPNGEKFCEPTESKPVRLPHPDKAESALSLPGQLEATHSSELGARNDARPGSASSNTTVSARVSRSERRRGKGNNHAAIVEVVSKLNTELAALKRELGVSELHRVEADVNFKDFLVFAILKKVPAQRKAVEGLPESKQHRWLSKRLAALYFGLSEATVEGIWKRRRRNEQ